MSWQETASETFTARHDARDTPDAELVLRALEGTRVHLERLFDGRVGELSVVLHSTEAQLDAAAPMLPALRRMTAPAGRRYLVGWTGEHELHLLAPRVLAKRASNVEGSLEMLMLAPGALLAKRIVAASNPGLPPPWGARAWGRYLRWAWLIEGAGQYFSGQSRHVRPVIARRLREGSPPSFPPGRADAPLLAGSLYEMVAREEGERAAVALACSPLADGPAKALELAFQGRALRHTEGTWRAQLGRAVRPAAR
ncbi:MAG: hypothetical protein QOE86_1192 [Solirubrobacteraceae bacterium]|nr:hypothetical protein [Solirubrobacteraceae bacterium]